MHRSEEKLAEDSHAWVIVEWNDSRLREAKDANLQNAVKHLVSEGCICNPMHSLIARFEVVRVVGIPKTWGTDEGADMSPEEFP